MSKRGRGEFEGKILEQTTSNKRQKTNENTNENTDEKTNKPNKLILLDEKSTKKGKFDLSGFKEELKKEKEIRFFVDFLNFLCLTTILSKEGKNVNSKTAETEEDFTNVVKTCVSNILNFCDSSILNNKKAKIIFIMKKFAKMKGENVLLTKGEVFSLVKKVIVEEILKKNIRHKVILHHVSSKNKEGDDFLIVNGVVEAFLDENIHSVIISDDKFRTVGGFFNKEDGRKNDVEKFTSDIETFDINKKKWKLNIFDDFIDFKGVDIRVVKDILNFETKKISVETVNSVFLR